MGRKDQKHKSIQSPSAGGSGAGVMSLAIFTLAIVLFVVTRYYILFVLHPQVSDIQLYYTYSARAVDLNQTPYQNDFEIEYPPLSFWTITAPRMLEEQPKASLQDFQQGKTIMILLDYIRAFRGLMFLCDLASFAILMLIVGKRRPWLTGWAALFYTITTAILGHLLYDRLDVGLLMLIMLGAYCWIRSLDESAWAEAWAAGAYAMIGLSISYKVIPVICVPFLLLSELYVPRRLIRLASALVALAAGIGLPFVIQYALSGSGVFDLFKQHAEREIQLESLYSTLMMIASLFGLPVSISHSHGAFNLIGSLSHGMKIFSTIVLFGFLAGLGIWALLRKSRYSRQNAYCFTCYVISGAVILSNVLSPQYFIWAFPLLLLLGVEILPERYLSLWILGALLIAVAAMTTWIFPYNYFCTETNPRGIVPITVEGPLGSSPTAYIVLGLRNAIYLGVVLWLGVILFNRFNQASNLQNASKA